MEIIKRYSSLILLLFISAALAGCSIANEPHPQALSSTVTPADASDSYTEERLFIETVLQRIDETLAAQENHYKAELLRREREERSAQQKYQGQAQARRDAETYWRERKAAENAARAKAERAGLPADINAMAQATEHAKRALDAAYQRERDAKSILEEKIRARETMERNEALRRQMAFQNSEAKKKWHLNPTAETLDEIEPPTVAMASSLGVTSRVHLQTKPLPGAVVYYQTKAGRAVKAPPLSTGAMTNCTETIPIGRYYIWAQRGTAITSNPERLIYIYEPEKNVDLPEDYKSGG